MEWMKVSLYLIALQSTFVNAFIISRNILLVVINFLMHIRCFFSLQTKILMNDNFLFFEVSPFKNLNIIFVMAINLKF